MLAKTLSDIRVKGVLSSCLGCVLPTSPFCLTFLLLPLAAGLVSVKDLRSRPPRVLTDLRGMSATCSL